MRDIFIHKEVMCIMLDVNDKFIRKNITLSPETNNDLKILSSSVNLSQSKVIAMLIEEKARGIKKNKKLEALENLKGCADGVFGKRDFKDIKGKTDE